MEALEGCSSVDSGVSKPFSSPLSTQSCVALSMCRECEELR